MVVRNTLIAIAAIALTGCASMSVAPVDGPRYKQVKNSIPKQDQSVGRIYFFREDKIFGWASRPTVTVNGEEVGASQPGSVFIVERNPGHYKVSIDSDIEFDLHAKDTKYVRMEPGMGVVRWNINPELKDVPTVNLDDLTYLGTR